MNDHLKALIGLTAFSFALPLAAQPAADDLDSLLGAEPPKTQTPTPQPTQEPAPPANAASPVQPAAPVVETPPAAEVDANPSAATIPVAAGPKAAKRGASRLVEEIVVTAQKREENLQDVPISVAAFSGDELEARGVNDPAALAAVTPGLTYNSLVGYSLIYIRGVGSDAFEPTADASVATYIDGVYLPFAHALAQEFVKLERIEVLKGPQGTLFGRNATGGAINIVTRKPSDSFEGSIDATGGNYNNREVKAFASGALFGGLSASVALLYNRQDSYYKLAPDSTVTSLDPDRTRAAHARLEWRPIDQFSITLSDLLTFSDGPGSTVNQAQNPKLLGATLGIRSEDTPRVTDLDVAPSLVANNHLYYGQAAWTPEWLDIKLLGSRQLVHTDLLYDFDSSKQPLVYFHATNQFSRVTSGELQLLSKRDGILPNWLQATGGLYYFKSSAGYDPVIFGLGPANNPLFLPPAITDPLLGLIPPGLPVPTSAVALDLVSTLKTEAFAAYLQTTFLLADWFDVTLGARVQREKRGTTHADVRLASSADPIPLISFPLANTTRDDLSPKATLDFKPWDGQLIYLTASQASKSGTYNLPAIYTPPRYVKPETVRAYEIGNKGSFLEGSLRYGVAVYLNQIKNLQTQIVSLQSGGAQNLVNADRARIYGVDFDLTWQVLPETLPGFVLKAAGSYINGEYTRFPDGSGFNPVDGVFFGQGSLTLSPPQDFSGNRAVRTPKYSFNIGPNYAVEIPGGTLELGLDYSYNSGYFFDTQNTVSQPAYSLLNARVSYLYQPFGVRVTAFGKNLTNAAYYINRFQTDFATNSIFNAPLTFGVTLGYDFKL